MCYFDKAFTVTQYFLSFTIVIAIIVIWFALTRIISDGNEDDPKSIIIAGGVMIVLGLLTYLVHNILF